MVNKQNNSLYVGNMD